jgi:hypothetical protein
MGFKIRMKKVMIHEIVVEADSFKHALGMCSRYCSRLDSFPLAGIRFEIESITRIEHDERGSKEKRRTGSEGKRKK